MTDELTFHLQYSTSFPCHRIADVVVATELDIGESNDGEEVSDVQEQEKHVYPPGGEPLELEVGLDERVGEEALLLGLQGC